MCLDVGHCFLGVAQEVVTGPAIALDKDVHIRHHSARRQWYCEFTVINSGTEPLIISRCKILWMHCSSVRKVTDRPRQYVSDHREVRHQAHWPINKSVTITSNASNEPTKVIRIKGKVEASDLGKRWRSSEAAIAEPHHGQAVRTCN